MFHHRVLSSLHAVWDGCLHYSGEIVHWNSSIPGTEVLWSWHLWSVSWDLVSPLERHLPFSKPPGCISSPAVPHNLWAEICWGSGETGFNLVCPLEVLTQRKTRDVSWWKYKQLGRSFQDKILGLKCLNSFLGLGLWVHLPIEKRMLSSLFCSSKWDPHSPKAKDLQEKSHSCGSLIICPKQGIKTGTSTQLLKLETHLQGQLHSTQGYIKEK